LSYRGTLLSIAALRAARHTPALAAQRGATSNPPYGGLTATRSTN